MLGGILFVALALHSLWATLRDPSGVLSNGIALLPNIGIAIFVISLGYLIGRLRKKSRGWFGLLELSAAYVAGLALGPGFVRVWIDNTGYYLSGDIASIDHLTQAAGFAALFAVIFTAVDGWENVTFLFRDCDKGRGIGSRSERR